MTTYGHIPYGLTDYVILLLLVKETFYCFKTEGSIYLAFQLNAHTYSIIRVERHFTADSWLKFPHPTVALVSQLGIPECPNLENFTLSIELQFGVSFGVCNLICTNFTSWRHLD